MTNGTEPATPDRRPYPLGFLVLEGPASVEAQQQLLKEAYGTFDAYGHVEINPEKASQINWYCASDSFVHHERLIAYLMQRVEVLEQALRKEIPGFVPLLPPGAATEEDVATLVLPNNSPVRIWPTAKGEYPTVKSPPNSILRIGTFELELEEEAVIERREDGVYVDDKCVLAKKAKAKPEEKAAPTPDG